MSGNASSMTLSKNSCTFYFTLMYNQFLSEILQSKCTAANVL